MVFLCFFAASCSQAVLCFHSVLLVMILTPTLFSWDLLSSLQWLNCNLLDHSHFCSAINFLLHCLLCWFNLKHWIFLLRSHERCKRVVNLTPYVAFVRWIAVACLLSDSIWLSHFLYFFLSPVPGYSSSYNYSSADLLVLHSGIPEPPDEEFLACLLLKEWSTVRGIPKSLSMSLAILYKWWCLSWSILAM